MPLLRSPRTLYAALALAIFGATASGVGTLSLLPALAASALAALLALRPHAPWRPLVALTVAGLLVLAGLLAPLNPTFPWVEIGRARGVSWEAAVLLGACALLAALRAVPTVGMFGTLTRVLGFVGVLALATSQLVPLKTSFQRVLPASAGLSSIPVWVDGEVRPMVWSRVVATGNAVIMLPANVRDEWTIMAIAQGIQASTTPDYALLRRGAWAVQKATVAFALGARVALLAALPLAAWRLLRNRAGRGHTALVALLRAVAALVPAANLAAVATFTLTLFPDDRALLLPGAGLAALWLLAVAACDRAAGPA